MAKPSFLTQLKYKFSGIAIRIWDALWLLYIRIFRLLKHLFCVINFIQYGQIQGQDPEFNNGLLFNTFMWFAELSVYFLECFGIGEIYETIVDLIKFNTRPMYDWEIKMAQSVFGDTIKYQRVRIDEKAIGGPKQYKFAYVSFYTINSWGPMSNSHLIHELMHVWQYEEMGAVYMPKAGAAQQSPNGYNYGGLAKLQQFIYLKKNIRDFNLEQQGDIVQDYYRLRQGFQPQWFRQATPADLHIYDYFVRQINPKLIKLDHKNGEAIA